MQHTSASLVIQENADPDVVLDLADFFERLVPEDDPRYRHTTEGSDDMPAHIRSALTQTSLSIPVIDGRMALGTWQGIYLFEHRSAPTGAAWCCITVEPGSSSYCTIRRRERKIAGTSRSSNRLSVSAAAPFGAIAAAAMAIGAGSS